MSMTPIPVRTLYDGAACAGDAVIPVHFDPAGISHRMTRCGVDTLIQPAHRDSCTSNPCDVTCPACRAMPGCIYVDWSLVYEILGWRGEGTAHGGVASYRDRERLEALGFVITHDNSLAGREACRARALAHHVAIGGR